MSEDRNKIIARVKKLREIRVDRGATEAEADTAKHMADKLVEKYTIADDEFNKSEVGSFMDSIFGDQEGYEHVHSKGGMSGTFSFKFGEDPEVDHPMDEFLKAFMGTGLGSFFQRMRNAGDGPSSFEQELFRTIDALLKAWGKKADDRKREDDKEDSEAPDSIEG